MAKLFAMIKIKKELIKKNQSNFKEFVMFYEYFSI
jgi:hypothetical protein